MDGHCQTWNSQQNDQHLRCQHIKKNVATFYSNLV
jgi:hypothetical protein